MQLVFFTHHNLLDLHAFSPAASWFIVLGAVYGGLRLMLDGARIAWRLIRKVPL